MKILMVCEDYRVGGAQVFALRLANALSNEYEVLLYAHYSFYIDNRLLARWAPNLRVISPKLRLDWLIRKGDRLLHKLKIDFSFRESIVAKHVKSVVKKNEIDLIHSHMFKSDYVVAKALRGTGIPLVTTMHGNYEGFLKNYLQNVGEVLINYPKKLQRTLAETDAVAYLTEKNLRVFREERIIPTSCYQHIIRKKIYNGFVGRVDQPRLRKDINIGDDDLVFGMVARGIWEKGWEVAIEAFKKLSNDKSHLVLAGWSEYVAKLAKKYEQQERIHFVGYSDNPLNWIQLFDVGLLPSVYGESLPNVIVEYLYCGKPSIVSDVGESKLMIEAKGQEAGFVLPVKNGRVDSALLCDLMEQYVQDQALSVKHGQLAAMAFKKFAMEKCIASYSALYHEVYKGRPSASLGHYAGVQLRSVC